MTDLKEHEDSLPEWSTDEDDEEVESKYNWLPYKTGEIPRYVPTETSVYTRPDPVEDAPEAEEGAEDVADGAEGEGEDGKKKKNRCQSCKKKVGLTGKLGVTHTSRCHLAKKLGLLG